MKAPIPLTPIGLTFAAALGLLVLGVALAGAGSPPAGALAALATVGGVALAVIAARRLRQEQDAGNRRVAERVAGMERQLAELRALTAASRALRTGLDLESLLDTVYLQTAHLLKVRNVAVALVAPDGEPGGLRFSMVVRGGRRVREAERDPAVASSRALVDHVVEMRAPLLLARDVGEAAAALGLRPPPAEVVSWMGAPLWLGVPMATTERPVGCIAVESHDLNRCFTEHDLNLLSIIAAQASVALANVDLYIRVDQALAQRARQLQAVLNSTHAGMLMIDRGGRVVLTNPQVEALTSLPRELWAEDTLSALLAQPGSPIAARLGFGSDPAALLALLDGLRTGELPPLERAQYPLGGRFIERSIEPVRDDAGALMGVLVALRDVTEAEQVRQTREALSSMIVHDLRSPLTAIQGSLLLIEEVTQEAGEIGPSLLRMTDTSLRAVRRLLNMVESLLDISKLGSGVLDLEREPTGLGPIVQEVFADLRPLADELGVSLALDAPAPPPLFDIDADKIRRVLLNLVDNALKFAPADEAVRVVVHAPGADGAQAGFVRVDVIDKGPGIPETDRAHLFEPFAQAREKRGRRRGTGLGLTFCRMAVEAHGGRIWIDDGPETGSVFAFTLPLAATDRLPGDAPDS